jgi:uncharacterized protein (DUF111 family)
VRGKVNPQGAVSPEYEDCREIAARTGTPLKRVLAAAQQAYLIKTQ